MKKCIKTLDGGKFKFLDRAEAVVASIDETKQLRLEPFCWNKCARHFLLFSQEHSSCKSFFRMDELHDIASALHKGLEEYLLYEIS